MALVLFAILGGFVVGFLAAMTVASESDAKDVANGFIQIGHKVYAVKEVNLKEDGQNEAL